MPSVSHKRKRSGFTLVEILVVISIIAVLAVVGMVVFTGLQREARDSKRKGDIDAISKAYEAKSNMGSYQGLANTDFASGAIPKDPSKGDYFNVVSSDGTGFKVCAALDNNPLNVCNTPASNCFCKFSSQGTINPSSNLSGTHIELGLGGGSSSSCDPNGTLLSGLVGHWKMDESSWTGASGEVRDSSGSNHGTSFGGASITTHTPDPLSYFKNAGSFDGVNDYVSITDSASLDLGDTISIATWVKRGVINGSEHVILNKGVDTYLLKLDAAGYPTFGSYGVANIARTSSAITDTASWHHIVATKNGSTTKIYLDGQDLTVNVGSDTLGNNATNLLIGAGSTAVSYPFNGQIDDVLLYNRALSQPEINTLYNGGSGCIP